MSLQRPAINPVTSNAAVVPPPIPSLMPMILPPPKVPMPGQNIVFCYNPMMLPPPMPMGMMMPMMMPHMRMPVRLPTPIFQPQPAAMVEAEAAPLDLTTLKSQSNSADKEMEEAQDLVEEETMDTSGMDGDNNSSDESADSKSFYKKNMLQRYRGNFTTCAFMWLTDFDLTVIVPTF